MRVTLKIQFEVHFIHFVHFSFLMVIAENLLLNALLFFFPHFSIFLFRSVMICPVAAIAIVLKCEHVSEVK